MTFILNVTYTDVDLATLDLDWFAIDNQMRLGHFVTRGIDKVPDSVRSNKSENEALLTRIQSIPDHYLNERLPKIETHVSGIRDVDAYFSTFDDMAKKGFYSHDAVQIDGQVRYLCVTAPNSTDLTNKDVEFLRSQSFPIFRINESFELGNVIRI